MSVIREYLRTILSRCNIVNGYRGLDEFIASCNASPREAFEASWDVLTQTPEYGRDDGALCLEVLRHIAACGQAPAFEARLLAEWKNLPAFARENFIYAFVDPALISLRGVVAIFENLSNSTRDRHLIVAMLASARFGESGLVLANLADRIGNYTDPHRQSILQRFLTALRQDLHSQRSPDHP